MAGMFFSCENDLENIKLVTATDDSPDQIVNNVHTLYSDTGVVRFEIIGKPNGNFFCSEKRRSLKMVSRLIFLKAEIQLNLRLQLIMLK